MGDKGLAVGIVRHLIDEIHRPAGEIGRLENSSGMWAGLLEFFRNHPDRRLPASSSAMLFLPRLSEKPWSRSHVHRPDQVIRTMDAVIPFEGTKPHSEIRA